MSQLLQLLHYMYLLIITIFVVIFQAFYPMDKTYDIKKGDILVRLNSGFI